jgi:predicted RNase H-like HicB family nuclease
MRPGTDKTKVNADEIKRIQALPYRRELVPDGDGWVARIPEFPGCVVEAESSEAALAQLEDVMAT